ncbi:MAG TPA: glycerol-3-phosphate dehydrogenase/oxidase [candidate division Zixibacteria bacterium]|nr:glycerol-3-phosphate dehydrogenase/oxidase [candidate division Zixibacteria bacterium]
MSHRKMWAPGWRDRIWSSMDKQWDIVVVGGGITGAGILNEAAKAGLRVLLLDKGDFASGTSSRSSKLVHGGLRYLRNGQLRTTVSSVHERERLLREGRGLVTPLGFLFANYEGDRTPRWALGLGLAVYDILGMRWGHKYYDAAGALKLAPNLASEGLQGGYRYFDAQTDDARLVLRVIYEGVSAGGTALNYAQVENLLISRDGRVRGVALRDLAPEGYGRTTEIQSGIVVNAAGASADVFRQQIGSDNRLRFLKGSHLLFNSDRFPINRAISFSHPVDQRPVFALPWEGVTLFGTTDVEHTAHPNLEPSISAAELDYLLVGAAYAFPSLHLAQEDVQATFSGIRSVVGTGENSPSKESREHIIWFEKGLLTVSGGKLTTFRVMARHALRSIRRYLPGRPKFDSPRVLDEPGVISGSIQLEPVDRARLAGRYGAEALTFIDSALPGELTHVDDAHNCRSLWAELRWAARCEGIVHLEDLLLRRVRIGLLLPQGGLPWMDRIRAITQGELGWNDERWERELQEYCSLWSDVFFLPPEY